jgi:hypothetical protein
MIEDPDTDPGGPKTYRTDPTIRIRNNGLFVQVGLLPNIQVPPDLYLYVILVDRPCYKKIWALQTFKGILSAYTSNNYY